MSTKYEKQHSAHSCAIKYLKQQSLKSIVIDSESGFCCAYNSDSFIQFFARQSHFTHIEIKLPYHADFEERLIRIIAAQNPCLLSLDIPTCTNARCDSASCRHRSNFMLNVYRDLLISIKLTSLVLRSCCDERLLCTLFCSSNFEIQDLTIWNNNMSSDGVLEVLSNCQNMRRMKVMHHHHYTIDGKYRINKKYIVETLFQEQSRTVELLVEVL
jgi:hypothetical protein